MRNLFGFQLLDKATATATAKDQGLSSVAAKVGAPVGGEGAPGSSAVSAKVGITGGGEGASGAPASPTLRSALP